MTKRILILVEGQTEEQFVKTVLGPALYPDGIFPVATILTTKRVKDGPNFKGGVTSYSKFKQDLNLVRAGAADAMITTMLDYYGLPADFPGMDTRMVHASTIDRVRHIEREIASDVSDHRFVPFLALHEFEALLFSCDNTLPNVIGEPDKQQTFAAVNALFSSPEEINENPGSNPAARITAMFPGYRKVLHGPTAIKRIGLNLARARCRHFDDWVCALETVTS